LDAPGLQFAFCRSRKLYPVAPRITNRAPALPAPFATIPARRYNGARFMLMILKSLFLQPLGPALVLAVSASLLMLWRWLALRRRAGVVFLRGSPGSTAGPDLLLHRLQLPAVLFAILAAMILLLLLRGAAARPALSWTWQPLTVAGGLLEWRMDGWNWLTAMLILLLTAGVVLHGRSDADGYGVPIRLDHTGGRLVQTLWLAAAALVFTASGNVVTLASSWMLFDAALAWRLRPGEHVEPTARVWSLLSLTAILLLLVLALLGEGGVKAALGNAYMGITCSNCGSHKVIRAGACGVCTQCGTSQGCS